MKLHNYSCLEPNFQRLLTRLEEFPSMKVGTKRLVILLGQLGDLDSFEYVQAIFKIYPRLKKYNINLAILAIGDQKSRNKFCEFNNISTDFIGLEEDASIHNELGLSPGLVNSYDPFFNLILMCLGYKSPGTLIEVLRGYTGDRNSLQIFKSEDVLCLGSLPKFKASLFNYAGGTGFMRPFEMATLRLINRIEIISHWKIYMSKHELLTQRGGTFLIGENNQLLYSYKARSLLGYSSTMNKPTSFIDKFLT